MGAVLGHVWSLNKGGKGSLGLSCGEDGLFLGGTPLVERRDERFFIRPQRDLERLLSRAYGAEIGLDRVMPGLAVVSSALERSDLCLARIAAVQLRLPDIPDAVKQRGMALEDAVIKRERGEDRLLRGDWDPDRHPRADTSPNPGWFAPKDGSGDAPTLTPLSHSEQDSPVKLPPGERIDRLARLAERIANAGPEDAAELREEIKREFYDAGDTFGGNAMNAALSDAVEAGSDSKSRQAILAGIEPYTHVEPSVMGGIRAVEALVIPNLTPLPKAGASAEAPLPTPEEPVAPAEPPPQASNAQRAGEAAPPSAAQQVPDAAPEAPSAEGPASGPVRPNWRQSEIDIGRDLGDGVRPQIAFKGGLEVSPTTKGSVRPDFVANDGSMGFEVKNYNIATNSNGLIRDTAEQAIRRASELPAGMKQKIVIDIRGQTITPEQECAIARRIVEKSNGIITLDAVSFKK